MALFSRTKNKPAEAGNTTKEEGVVKVKQASSAKPTDVNTSAIIIQARVTEKAVRQNDANVYTFIVAKHATKYTVADAIKALFKVTPVKVNIVNKSPRQFMSRSKGRALHENGMKKAYVYLKKGDRIDLV